MVYVLLWCLKYYAVYSSGLCAVVLSVVVFPALLCFISWLYVWIVCNLLWLSCLLFWGVWLINVYLVHAGLSVVFLWVIGYNPRW